MPQYALLALALVGVSAGAMLALRRRKMAKFTEAAAPNAEPDPERRPDMPEIDLVDEAGFESFPASDPPSYAGR